MIIHYGTQNELKRMKITDQYAKPFYMILLIHILAHRGRDASCPTPPAQIPACRFLAPGSSEVLASVSSFC